MSAFSAGELCAADSGADAPAVNNTVAKKQSMKTDDRDFTRSV